jgi:hypothetical protein
MWEMTVSSFGSEGGYPKISFSSLLRHENILILLLINHGLCLSLPLHFSYSPNLPFRERFCIMSLNTAALSRRRPASGGASCDIFLAHGHDKETRVTRASDRTYTNRNSKYIWCCLNTHENQSESLFACLSLIRLVLVSWFIYWSCLKCVSCNATC